MATMLSDHNSSCPSDQIYTDWVATMTDSVWWTRPCQSSSNHWRVHRDRWFRSPLGTSSKLSDHSSFGPQRGSGTLEKYLYTRKSTSECAYRENMGHTGVVLEPRRDCLSSVSLSPHFLQTTLGYTPYLELLAVWFLCVSRNERYGCTLRWSAARSRYRLEILISKGACGAI